MKKKKNNAKTKGKKLGLEYKNIKSKEKEDK